MESQSDLHPDLLIMTFPAGSSLSRWDRFGQIERELPFIRGLVGAVPRVLFVSVSGDRDAQLGQALNAAVADVPFPGNAQTESEVRIDAMSESVPDHELGTNRSLEERVLARVGGVRNIVIQTMQFDDGGIARRLLSPLRRIGMNVALVARGSFINSRVLSGTLGPHHFKTLSLGATEQQICSLAQLVVGTTETMIDELCWKNGISAARARVVPQHVDISDVDTRRVDDLIVTAGRLDGDCAPLKAAIESVAGLSPAQRDSVRLEILGDGLSGFQLPAYAESLGVRAEVRRGLAHEEIQKTLAIATIFLQTEASRRQSRTVLEAMGAGCPVVVTGLPEYVGYIENGSTGIVVNPEGRAFTFAIDCLLNDKSFRRMLGDSARTRIAFKCGVDHSLKKMLSCFNDAIEAAPQSGGARGRRAS